MLKRIFLGLLATLAILGASNALRADVLLLNVTGQTTTVTTAVITTPPYARGLIAWIDVTAGTGLLIDMQMLAYNLELSKTATWGVDCPSADGITGISTTSCIYDPTYGTEYTIGAARTFIVKLPPQFQFQVVHGNTEAATYTLRIQWLR